MLAASDREEALLASHKVARTIDILVSDIVLPKLDGVSLYKQVLRERPTIKVLLIFAYANVPIEGCPFCESPSISMPSDSAFGKY